MGLSHEQAAKQAAALNPTITPEPSPTPGQPKVEQATVEDATLGNEERLRGIPAVGRVSGTIKGTRPGDTVWALEQSERDLRAALMRRARQNLGK